MTKVAMSKVTTTKKAIAEHVRDGDFVYIGGYICRTPYAVIHEIIRQGRKDLTITRSNAADDFDMLIGAGVVKRFHCNFPLAWIFRSWTVLPPVNREGHPA